MQNSRSTRPIAWVIALLTVAAVWQLDLPNLLEDIALSLGADKGSLTYLIIIDGGVAIVLVGISWLALHLYEDLIWRWWPGLGNEGGWWVYALVSQRQNSITRVAGVFYMQHKVAEVAIVEGHAWYVQEGRMIPRGHWQSETVWITRKQIQTIFNMHATNPSPEAMPSLYEGYMSLSHTATLPKLGIESWEGYFHDLGDRRAIVGWIYCERLSPLLARRRDIAEEKLRSGLQLLVDRAESLARLDG